MCTQDQQVKHLLQQGFTMIEAMVVAGMLAFGFVAANKAQVNLYKARQSVTMGASATYLSAQQIEQLRGYTSLADYGNIAGSSGQTSDANTTLSRTLVVTDYNKYKQINLSVSWVDGSNSNQTIALTNYVSQNDPQLSGLLLSSNYNTSPLPTPGASSSNSNSSSTSTSGTSTSTASTSTTDTSGTGISNVGTSSTGASSSITSSTSGGGAVTLSGVVSLATGSIAPGPSVLVSNVTLTASSTNSLAGTCTYSTVSGSFSCTLAHGWSGSINVGGVSSVKICVQNSQPYSNLLTSLTDQNYLLVKSSKNCPTTASFLLQIL